MIEAKIYELINQKKDGKQSKNDNNEKNEQNAFNEFDFSIALEHRLTTALPGSQVRKLWTLENRGIVTWN